jgi:hypothetical protein|tara:strand:- start:374 stop:664 length:291 start_codon:yes stop_codon:yes gene_type:complete
MFIKKYAEFLLEVKDGKIEPAGDKEKKDFENNDGSDKDLEKKIADELEDVTEDCARCGEHLTSCKCESEDPWSTQVYHRAPKGVESKKKPKQEFKK